jgi:hypothetical protein
MTGKSFAIVVKKEGDALSASTEEGHGGIGRYLRHFNNNVSSGGDHAQLINPEAEDLIDFSDDNRSSAQPPHLPQNSAPLQSSAPPAISTGVISLSWLFEPCSTSLHIS